MNGDLLAVGPESDGEVVHLSYCAYRIAYRARPTRYTICTTHHQCSANFMPDFPLGTPLLAANFAPASRFCHLFLHKPPKNSIVKNFQTVRLYDMIKVVESKQKFVYPGEKYVQRPRGTETVDDLCRRSTASALADSDWGEK